MLRIEKPLLSSQKVQSLKVEEDHAIGLEDKCLKSFFSSIKKEKKKKKKRRKERRKKRKKRKKERKKERREREKIFDLLAILRSLFFSNPFIHQQEPLRSQASRVHQFLEPTSSMLYQLLLPLRKIFLQHK
ncbi:MAG: hypothetical protein Q8P67_21070 [archaeon]|nr:hypothetical protein [archaeon]